MVFMILERFRNSDPVPVYRRLRDRGRLVPAGLQYIDSWVTTDLTRCFQVMACADRTQLDAWMAEWSDLIDFDVIPVITSADARAAVAERL
jgi:uncharacterized protein DUF3303